MPRSPRERAIAAFEQAFGHRPATLVQAPGRVNLIGEHTDYNEGFVLPCAIDRGTVVAAAPRRDARVRVVAADLGGPGDEFRLDAPIGRHAGAHWSDYVRGCVVQLLDHLGATGGALGGADLAIAGNVPQGTGLSSSASLEVAVLYALTRLHGLDELDAATLARLAQQAENRFVGCACGIMDQLASACGVAGHALLIDCRSLALQAVPLPAGVAVLIADSRVPRGLVGSEYNLRRAQCEAAARHFGVAALRDLPEEALSLNADALDPLIRRRARHVVTENRRTRQAAEALSAGDLTRMGELMNASHASMRDDFGITVPAIDALVDLLQAAIGDAGGARMTGGGFGGCAVALLPAARVDDVTERVTRSYRSPGGDAAMLHVCRACAGAGALTWGP